MRVSRTGDTRQGISGERRRTTPLIPPYATRASSRSASLRICCIGVDGLSLGRRWSRQVYIGLVTARLTHRDNGTHAVLAHVRQGHWRSIVSTPDHSQPSTFLDELQLDHPRRLRLAAAAAQGRASRRHSLICPFCRALPRATCSRTKNGQ